jgi:hypothetical protein
MGKKPEKPPAEVKGAPAIEVKIAAKEVKMAAKDPKPPTGKPRSRAG